ncbi:alanine racemase [Haloflavibacter putidus]|uniref:Alanine racemase n=1 Tax=Haloflavibacter putidus TaxID=2576776 RepID=A0A507ZS47_9FLAO|nr:alanine racemase [Haloflavibacter putidus]TQD37665.1 alanine racemase [Haloflavibacter putidus]
MIINHSSTIEIDRNALANNLKFIRNLIGEKVQLSSVIKGNAYGHGIKQILPELELLGVNHFAVYSSFEAKIAHQYTTKPASKIMVMGDISAKDQEWVIKNKIEFFVFNLKHFKDMLALAKKTESKLYIHLELETGMNRHGLLENQYEEIENLLAQNKKYICLKGICTHFAGAESSANFKRIETQKKRFSSGLNYFIEKGHEPQYKHTSCSAGIIAYPECNHNLVRVGILQYGLWPSQEIELMYNADFKKKNTLKSVLSWRSKIVDVKTVKAGEFVGYGNSFLAETAMKIASVPIGYGYGFSRSLSNTGRVLVNGKRLSVIGTVNMNMFLIEVTNIDVEIGDTVTLIGKDGEQAINVSYFGDLSEQLNYELLTRLDKSIPRQVI